MGREVRVALKELWVARTWRLKLSIFKLQICQYLALRSPPVSCR